MEKNILNTNQHSFTIDGQNGSRKITIKTIESADEASFLTYDQSLVLKVSVDGEYVISEFISHFPVKDQQAKIAEINKTFTDFNELVVSVHAENDLLSADINFNIIVNFE